MSERERQIVEIVNATSPFTYAYRYSDGLIYYGTGGRSINGGQPTEAIALYSAEQMNRAVQEALATPATSEWNEAIEAALNAILDRAQAYEAQDETASYIDLMDAVCALKRKEQP